MHPLGFAWLAKCNSLEVFFFKTPLPVVNSSEPPLIHRWAQRMPHLQRFYLFHGYDEDAGIGNTFWLGSRELHERMTGNPTQWNCLDITPLDENESDVSDSVIGVRVREVDFDIYDSDVE